MAKLYTCTCGVEFGSRQELYSHMAVSNERWPSAAVDEHKWKVIEPRVENEDGLKTV